MITDNQKEYIQSLYEELGQEPEIDLDDLSRSEAHRTIRELLEIKNEVESVKIIRADRGQGKTTELIKMSNKEWKYIVCTDITRVTNIVAIANRLGLDIPFPITVRELPLSQGTFIESVLIDDIEDVIQYLIGKKVDYVTTSCEVVELRRKL